MNSSAKDFNLEFRSISSFNNLFPLFKFSFWIKNKAFLKINKSFFSSDLVIFSTKLKYSNIFSLSLIKFLFIIEFKARAE